MTMLPKPRAAESYAFLLVKIRFMAGTAGPYAAARFVTEKASNLDWLVEQADDPATLMAESLRALGLAVEELTQWSHGLRDRAGAGAGCDA